MPTSSGLARGVSATDVITSVKKTKNAAVDFAITRMLFLPDGPRPPLQCPAALPEADAADHLFENRLVCWEFVFRGDEDHIKECLVIQARHDPCHFRFATGVGFADHDGPQPRFITDQRLCLCPRHD